MKTPEELAVDYCEPILSDDYAKEIGREDWIGTRCVKVGEGHEMYKAFLAGYAAAQTNLPTPAKWISVKERLPEINSLVVILHEDEMNLNYRKPPVYFGKHNGQYWLETLDHSDVTWNGMCNITHWMPLPAPPKEDEYDTR